MIFKMVRLTSITTRGGDKGKTSLASSSGRARRVAKTHPRIAAIGEVDALNAAVGVALDALPKNKRALAQILARIQNDLFDIGADLSVPSAPKDKPKNKALRVTPAQLQQLDDDCARLNKGLPPLRSFILPSGNPATSALHVARAQARRAERAGWALAAARGEKVNAVLLRYLNRLSDCLFIAARRCAGREQRLWVPGNKSRV